VTPAEVPNANFSSEPDPSKVVGSGREQREGNRFKSLNRSFPTFSVTKASVPGITSRSVLELYGLESEVSATVPMVEPSLTTQRRRPEGLVLRAG